MVRYASLLSVDLPKMYLWCKFKKSTPCNYLGTELHAAGEYLPSMFNDPSNIVHFSKTFPLVYMEQV